MNHKTIIIDNNKQNSTRLEELMRQHLPHLKIIANVQSPNEGLELLQNHKAQLLFVNIADLTGEQFMQLKALQQKSFSIIFVTPSFVEENFNQLPDGLFKMNHQKGIQLRIGKIFKSIPLKNIIRFQVNSNYTKVYLNNNYEAVLTSKTLKHYADKIDDNVFIRPHQSHLVNKSFVDTIHSQREHHLILKDGFKVKVARRKVREIKEHLVKMINIEPPASNKS